MSAGKLVVFDWNGTLIDDVDLVQGAANVILKHFGRAPVGLARFQECFDAPIARFYENLGFLAHELGEVLERTQDIFHDYYEERAIAAPLRDGAAQLLQSVKRTPGMTIILSNHIQEPIRLQLGRFGVEKHIDHVLAYESRATQFKHETKGQKLKRFMEENKVAPGNAVIIGDTPEEAHIAHEYGMTGILITGGYASEDRLRAARPHHLVHDFAELHAVLREREFTA